LLSVFHESFSVFICVHLCPIKFFWLRRSRAKFICVPLGFLFLCRRKGGSRTAPTPGLIQLSENELRGNRQAVVATDAIFDFKAGFLPDQPGQLSRGISFHGDNPARPLQGG